MNKEMIFMGKELKRVKILRVDVQLKISLEHLNPPPLMVDITYL